MKKYVIKNCPAYSKDALDFCFMKNATQAICYNCTDCVLKQIVKITKNYTKACGKHCDINRKENNCGRTCNAYKIRQILELLDIQEVE